MNLRGEGTDKTTIRKWARRPCLLAMRERLLFAPRRSKSGGATERCPRVC